jgi:hypothetical protein
MVGWVTGWVLPNWQNFSDRRTQSCILRAQGMEWEEIMAMLLCILIFTVCDCFQKKYVKAPVFAPQHRATFSKLVNFKNITKLWIVFFVL